MRRDVNKLKENSTTLEEKNNAIEEVVVVMKDTINSILSGKN